MYRRILGSILFGVFYFTFSAWAQVSPSFVVPVDLPEAGLRITVPARATEEPLPPLERRLYRYRQGERTWTEERYSPRDIWLRSQIVGQWRDQHENRIRILRPNHRLPQFTEEAVERSYYDTRVGELGKLDSPTSDDVLGWLTDYLRREPGDITDVRHVSHPVQVAVEVEVSSEQRLVYVLRVASGDAGLRNISIFFIVDITLHEDADVGRVRQSFEQRFLRSLDVFSTQQGSGGRQGTEMSGGRESSIRDSASMARSRAEAHASVANLRNWDSVDIGDYVLLSDERRGSRRLVRDLEQTLEPMREAFAAMIPPPRPIESVGIIRYFADQDEYVRYVGADMAWTAGIWSPRRGELVVRPVDAANYRQARERILSTIYHEAFHQYLSLATEPLRVCKWFNEGHAELFEHTNLQRDQVRFVESEQHVALAGNTPLSKLFSMDRDEFYHKDTETRRANYANAWAFVYYLRRSEAADPDFAFAGFLDQYMKELTNAGDGQAAMQRLLEYFDLEALEEDYHAFWDSTRRRRDALRAP